MQTWPWLKNDPQAPTDTASSRSTSSRITSAELPPSSRCTRLRCCAPSAATPRPPGAEPVKAITRTSGSATTEAPTSAPPGSMCSNPSGGPASAKICASTTPPETAVRGSCFRITALPKAGAGATARMDSTMGTLNGDVEWGDDPNHADRQPPREGQPGLLGTQQLPVRRGGKRCRLVAFLAALAVSKAARPAMAPLSRISHSPISSACAVNRSPARRNTAARPVYGRAAQARCASRAAAAATRTSPGEALPILPSD